MITRLGEWTAGDVVIVVVAVAGLVGLTVWGHRARGRTVSLTQVRRTYGAAFAAIGWQIADVTVLQIDRDLWQLSVLLAPVRGRGCVSDPELMATATLVGLNAMDIWPRLIAFEARRRPDGDDVLAQRPIVVLTRGHGRHAGRTETT